MEDQPNLGLKVEQKIASVEEYKFEPIKGYPMLHWKGKRPFTTTQFYPAQLKETHGKEVDGWFNKIFWGDNLQVMSHLLKEYRGQIDLISIDPPYDSNANYKKSISIKSQSLNNEYSVFEEKQYHDIWSNDDYLQFMYERLLIMRELLSDRGSIWIHVDFRRDSHIRLILDEIFGPENLRAQVIWNSTRSKSTASNNFGVNHNTIYYYTKKNNGYTWNLQYSEYEPDKLDRYYCFFEQEDGSFERYTKSKMKEFRLAGINPKGRRFALIPLLNLNKDRPNLTYDFLGFNQTWAYTIDKMNELYKSGMIIQTSKDAMPLRKQYLDSVKGIKLNTIWNDISPLNSQATEKVDYPTQKPEELLKRIIEISTNKGDLVFDPFMGSGTTQIAAMKLGRKFIGADINLGAIQTTTKRLINFSKVINSKLQTETIYTGFTVSNINNYDIFRNPVEAKELLIKALEIQPLTNNSIYDGEKDGRMVKVMPINRIATRADLNELVTNFDYKKFEKAIESSPNKPVEQLLLICMGHEADLAAELQNAVPYKLDIEVVDILRDKANLEFKRDAEAEIVIEGGKILVREFFPMNLMQKLSLMKENVDNWKELVDSIMIDFNYDGAVIEPIIVDVPEGNNLVKGIYTIPENAGTIRVKITDLLSETFETTLNNG